MNFYPSLPTLTPQQNRVIFRSQFPLARDWHVRGMEIERDTIPEETLIALLAKSEDFTEEEIRELQQKLPLMEQKLKHREVTPEQFERLEAERRNLTIFEAMVREQKALAKEKPKEREVLVEGQTPLTSEVFYKLLSAVPILKPCPLSSEPCPYLYFGYSTDEKYYLKVSSLSGELLYEIEIAKVFLL